MSYYIARNQGGVLPLTFPFEIPMSGDLTLAFSGSCWASQPASMCGVSVYLDDKHLGDVPMFFNYANVHLPLPAAFFPVNLDFGPHTITLKALSGVTRSDQNDPFSLWIVT